MVNYNTNDMFYFLFKVQHSIGQSDKKKFKQIATHMQVASHLKKYVAQLTAILI